MFCVGIAAGEEKYPEGIIEEMSANFKTVVLDAAKIAMDIGNPKCMNIVLFGAMVKALNLNDIDWEEALRETLPAKILDINLKAFKAGYDA